MSVTYDPTDLSTTTPEGRLNVVRFLVGDTDTTSAELQDEEIVFWLAQSNDAVYEAAASCASGLASKYATLVTTKLDGVLSSEYNELFKRYQNLSLQLRADNNRLNGNSLGIYIGGLPTPPTKSYVFYRGQFGYPYDRDDYFV